MMDKLDRAIINQLQGDFPLCANPYAEVAQQLGTSENELLARIQGLLGDKVLTRFGPMYHAERMGGGNDAIEFAEWLPPNVQPRTINKNWILNTDKDVQVGKVFVS